MPSVTAQPDLSSPAAASPEATTPSSPQTVPDLVHSLRHGSSILALAVSPEHGCIYAGTQDGEIVAWSLATFHQLHHVQAHKRSVLSLSLSPDASLLFSSAGDSVTNVWCPRTLRRLYEIYGALDVGEIFCIAYSPQHNTLYLGAQETTIQWIGLGDASARIAPDSQSHPDRRNHRFFDSKAVGGTSTPRRNDCRWNLIPRAQAVLEMHADSVCHFAHYGYVYCMLVAKSPTVEVDAGRDVLISGGGDGIIKLWTLADSDGHIDELTTLGTGDAESVLSLALDGSFLYAGKLDGIVELWDLDTTQRLRVIKAHGADVMSLHMGWGYLWTASANGCASRYSTAHYGAYRQVPPGDVTQKYQCLGKWKAHRSKILSSAVTTYGDHRYFITGANDNEICVWSVREKGLEQEQGQKNGQVQEQGQDQICSPTRQVMDENEDLLVATLADFVSYKTVSSRPDYAEDCRKGATFLGALFKRLGGHVEMLSTEKAHNPVVYARFSGHKEEPAEGRKRILMYGHYDVVAADNKYGKWKTDPFTLKGTNGFLYGRGVSDNKGPVVAALFAVTDLMQAQKLQNDIVFLIEGEEEVGSRGFEEVVERHRDLIGHVDYILLANSYWLNDEVPCLTYGLRGVLHATVSVEAPRPDLHSGVDGSHLVDEPLTDLTSILSRLKGDGRGGGGSGGGGGNRIQIPGFYDGIPPIRPEEEARYDDIAAILGADEGDDRGGLKRSLMARWREPNLSIHRYKVSGPEGSLISSHASSRISLRLVPGQEVEAVAGSLTTFLQREFSLLESQNRLSINIDNKAEPWLGDPTNAIFRTLRQAIVETWPDRFDLADESLGSQKEMGSGDAAATSNGQNLKAGKKPKQPLFIREGGSIPAIRFLEKRFGAPAAHLPCGRASDAAHLDNERMSLINLVKARDIFAKVFARL